MLNQNSTLSPKQNRLETSKDLNASSERPTSLQRACRLARLRFTIFGAFFGVIASAAWAQNGNADLPKMLQAILDSIWIVGGGLIGGAVIGFLIGTLLFKSKLDNGEAPSQAGVGGCLVMAAFTALFFFLAWFWVLSFKVEWYWLVIAGIIVLVLFLFGLKKRSQRKS